MKILQLKWLSLMLIILISFLIISCEKETSIMNDTFVLEEEENEIVEDVDVRVGLEMTFSNDMNPDEIETQWNEALTRYLESNESNRTTTSWAFIIRTFTGSGASHGTTGNVRSTIVFNTNTSRSRARNIPLFQPTPGAQHFRYMEVINASPRTSVSLRSTRVQLQGTDNWFPTRFDVYMPNYLQPNSSSGARPTGGSAIYRTPNQFLVNSTSGGWDTFSSGVVSGAGTITWP